MTDNEMWQKYCMESGVDPATPYEAWAFCGGGPLADELARLVLAGTKTATASLGLDYEVEGEPHPLPDCYSVVLYDDGSAACVIRNTKVSVVPFCEVSEEHAFREGEGDRSLAYWREVHRPFFLPSFQRAGLPFDEHADCVLEEFEVVYPKLT